MGEFVDTPMPSEFVKIPAGYKGTSPGTYDGDDCPGFAEYRRTPSPNAVPEKIYVRGGEWANPKGENDHMPETYDQERQSDIDQGKVKR